MAFAFNNNTKIYYEIIGKGEPLILITGYASSINYWSPSFIRHLKTKFSLILIDNRGMGKSGSIDEGVTIKTFANDIICVLKKEKIENANIAGISMGGFIAQEFAILYPNSVKKLVLISTHFGGKNRIPPNPKDIKLFLNNPDLTYEENITNKINVLFSDQFKKRYFKTLFKYYSKNLKNIPIKTLVNQKSASQNFCAENRINKIKAPVLILHGKEDKIVLPENTKLLQNKLFNSKIVLFKNVGHALITEQPVKAANEITNFLKLINT